MIFFLGVLVYFFIVLFVAQILRNISEKVVSAAHRQHFVGFTNGASDIVSNHHDGAAQLTVYLSYSRIHLVRGVGVKSGHRLVEKEQLIGGAYCSR